MYIAFVGNFLAKRWGKLYVNVKMVKIAIIIKTCEQEIGNWAKEKVLHQ